MSSTIAAGSPTPPSPQGQVPPPPPGGASVARIADLTYRGYEGPFKTHVVRWWTVALSTIRTNLRKPAFWILAGIIVVLYLVNGLIFYLTKNIVNVAGMEGGGGALAGAALDFAGHNSLYAKTLMQCETYSGILLFLIALIIGSGSIAADNRANALLVYLSKPLTKGDYLLGKWVGVFVLLAAVSLIPALLMYLFFLTAYFDDGFLRGNGWLILRILAASLIAPALHASLVIGFSAWSRSAAVAGAIFAGFFFLTWIVTNLLIGPQMFESAMLAEDNGTAGPGAIRQGMTVMYLSVNGVAEGLGTNIYDVDPMVAVLGRYRDRMTPPAVIPLLALGAVFIIAPLAAARVKIRAVEVVKG